MNKRTILSLVAALCLTWGGMASGQGRDDLAVHKDCDVCGMSRVSFDFSRMLIQYNDGRTAAICSLRCAAVDLKGNAGKKPKWIKAADFNGRHLIDAEKAFWVVGGNRPGVMSRRAKWTFEKKEDAEAFVKANQGQLASWAEALKTAYDDLGPKPR